MRDFYIALVKRYLADSSDNATNLYEIKQEVLSIGVTEKEFNEALRQFALDPDHVKLSTRISEDTVERKTKKAKISSFKQIIQVDIVTHLVLGGIIVGTLLLFPNLIDKLRMRTLLQSSTTQVSTVNYEKAAAHDTFTEKVYASTKVIDASQVFSYPANNISLTVTGTPKREVFGFFPYWMLGNEKKVNLQSITSLSLFGLEVDGNGNIVTVHANGEGDKGWQMWNDPALTDLINRAKKQGIKIQVTVKSFNNDNINSLVLSDKAQQTFIANVIYLINSKSLNGVNLDFEYNGTANRSVAAGFNRLITNLNSELKHQIPGSALYLDAYVHAASIPSLLDVSTLSDHVDAFVVMGYDIHTPHGNPGPIAPLDGAGGIIGYMQSFLEKVDPSKLILAVPYYAYDWQTTNNTTETENAGDMLSYAEIANESRQHPIQWDDASQTPWYTYEQDGIKHEVHFENVRSLGAKYDYINKKNLRGVGIWALGYDGLNTDLLAILTEKFSR